MEARTGLTFGAVGVAGAILGTALNRLVGGRAILLAFAVLLLVAAVTMLRRAPESPTRDRKPSFVRVAPVGFGTGVLTGFFGVGGGFVIVPALVLLLGLPLALAVFTGAAIAGALAGRRVGAIVSPQRLGQLFALLLVAIAVFLVAKNVPALL